MKILFRPFIFSLVSTLALAQQASAAELLTNGNFATVVYSGTPPLTTKFGQFGTGTGSTLSVTGWATTGYNFVFAPGTADSGTANGANTGQANEAPGQYNTNSGYGSTYLWGANNGGLLAIPPSPAGGNFVAADGVYEAAAITQSVSGLTVGSKYSLSFFWAAAQQQGFDGATTEQWQVSLGSQTLSTSVFNLPNHSFSGWMSQTFVYTATASTETLSFLANGTPTGLPPFVLLSGVSLTAVPEPSAWMVFVGLGAACTVAGILRRRRRAALADGLDE